MTLRDKKMRAAAIAATYFMQEELINVNISKWGKMGNNINMNGREFVQRKK